jgi:hypothetical protein
VLKGEYKVITGKMYVRSLPSLSHSLRPSATHEKNNLFGFKKTTATTSSGMAKASASSPLAMGKKSAWTSNTLFRRNRSGFADSHLLYG